MYISQFEVVVMPETDYALNDSCVLTIGDYKDALFVPASYVTMDVVIADIVSLDILGHIVGESNFVDPLLSFDILSGFLSRSNDALAFSFMDFSFSFEYSSASSIDDMGVCASHSPTTQIHDIDV